MTEIISVNKYLRKRTRVFEKKTHSKGNVGRRENPTGIRERNIYVLCMLALNENIIIF